MTFLLIFAVLRNYRLLSHIRNICIFPNKSQNTYLRSFVKKVIGQKISGIFFRAFMESKIEIIYQPPSIAHPIMEPPMIPAGIAHHLSLPREPNPASPPPSNPPATVPSEQSLVSTFS